jgi:hypothetical protein
LTESFSAKRRTKETVAAKISDAGDLMMRKLFVSVIVSGCLCGYAALLYGLIHILLRINNEYLLSLAK